MGQITIKECTDENAHEWDEYLKSSNTASFYHLYGWRKINEECFKHKTFYSYAIENSEISGVFPLVLVSSKLFGRILCSMPFVNFGGICSNNAETEQALYEHGIKIAQKHNADHVEYRNIHPLTNQTVPTNKNKISMTIKLDDNPETIWNGFTSKHRTNIRRAYKNGLSVKSGGSELLDSFYYILARSWKELGTPIYKKSYFKKILDVFPDSIKIFICYKDDKPIAAAFNGHFMQTVEGMWAGSLPKARRLQYSYVLYWEMIKDACENKYSHYHLGRSSVNSGGEQFKKKWKAETTQLYWQYYLNKSKDIPQLNVNNPKYKLMINTWKKLPVRLTTIIGPLVAKYIP